MSLRPAHPARDYCLAPERVDAPVHGGGRYRKLFTDLPVLDVDDAALHARPAGRTLRRRRRVHRPTLPAREPGRFGLVDVLLR